MTLFKSDSPEKQAIYAQAENIGDNNGAIVADNKGVIIVKQGLGYEDTKALCRDLVHEEMEKYKNEAQAEARIRRDELDDAFTRKLSEKQVTDQQALAEFRNPSMQYDYLEAQKAYIKAGTPELCAILSDILVQRAGETSRSLLQIALGEAIHVAPKLIPSQMATLALVFNLNYTIRLSVNSHESFARYLKTFILPLFQKGVSQKASEFQHLNYTGCSQFETFGQELPKRVRNAYAGLFMKGFTEEELPKTKQDRSFLEQYPDLFVQCLNDQTKIQINAIREKDLEDKLNARIRDRDDQAKLVNLFEKNQMNDEKTMTLILQLVPEMQELAEYWENSNISRLTLTSVGIIIGAQYGRLITGQKYDLKIWI